MSSSAEEMLGEVVGKVGDVLSPATSAVQLWGEVFLYVCFGAPWGWGVKIVAFAIVDTLLSPFRWVKELMEAARSNVGSFIEIGKWIVLGSLFLELLRGYFGVVATATWSVHSSHWAPFWDRFSVGSTLNATCTWVCFDKWWHYQEGEWNSTASGDAIPPGCEMGLCNLTQPFEEGLGLWLSRFLAAEGELVVQIIPPLLDGLVAVFTLHFAFIVFGITWRVRAVKRMIIKAQRDLEVVRGTLASTSKEDGFQFLEIDQVAAPVFFPLPGGGFGRYVRLAGTRLLLRQDVPASSVGTGPQRREGGLEAQQPGSSYRASERKYYDQLAILSQVGQIFGRAFRVRVKVNGKNVDYLVTTKHSWELTCVEKDFFLHNEAAGVRGLYRPDQFAVAAKTVGEPEIGGGDLVLLRYPEALDAALQLKAAVLEPVVEPDTFAQIWVGYGGTPMRAVGRVSGENIGIGLYHSISTEPGISGTPLRNVMGKVIGVHQGTIEDCDGKVSNVFQDARLIEVMARSDETFLESPNMKRRGRHARIADDEEEIDYEAEVEYASGEQVDYAQIGMAAKFRKHERRQREGDPQQQVGSKAQVNAAKMRKRNENGDTYERADDLAVEHGNGVRASRPESGKRSPEEVLSGLEKALDLKASLVFAKLTEVADKLESRTTALGSSKTATEQPASTSGVNNPPKVAGPGGSPPPAPGGQGESKVGKTKGNAKSKPKDKPTQNSSSPKSQA